LRLQLIKYSLLGILFAVSLINRAQNSLYHINNTKVYDFLDEMASEGLLQINTAIKPYTEQQIISFLKTIEESKSTLNKRQHSQLQFYLYYFNLTSENDTLSLYSDAWHNLFRKNSHAANRFAPLGFYYADSLFKLRVEPVWGYTQYSNSAGQITHSYGGAMASASIGNNWGIYASVRDNYVSEILAFPTYLTPYEGGSYKLNEGGRKGGDYSEMRGGIIYSWKWGYMGLVKDHQQWGNNSKGSIIISSKAPSYAMLKLNLHPTKWFEFNYFHGWLVSMAIDSSRTYLSTYNNWRQAYQPKYIASNMFTAYPWKSLAVSIGNSIIYSDMPVHPAYLIPVMFFKSIDHTINRDIENQNSQLFADISFRGIRHLHLYGSLFVDELSFTRINDAKRHNFYSHKAGMTLNNWPIKNIMVGTEYYMSIPLVYQHKIASLTYASNKYSLGHYLGDNAKEFVVFGSIHPINRLSIAVSYTKSWKGNYHQYTNGNGADTLSVLKDIIFQQEIISGTITYFLTQNIALTAGIENANRRTSSADGLTAAEYAELFIPQTLRGKKNTITLGIRVNL